jgi:hypothetical protein
MAVRINCRDCKFYYITFDAGAPYGCRAYGFKSKQMPSVAVRQSSGNNCQLFSSKSGNGTSGSAGNKKGGNFYA